MLSTLASGSYNVVLGATFTNNPTTPDGGTTFADASTTAVNTKYAIEFDSDGLPKTFNVAEIEILDFANGAADMDDDPTNAKQITFDLGTVTEANGFTQFGTEFVPVFITQNGSRFGTFAGVSIATSGLVTALFDNGETRPIFQIPVATFTNPNELEGARATSGTRPRRRATSRCAPPTTAPPARSYRARSRLDGRHRARSSPT